MNREQDIKKILSGEPLEVPESLLPENMKRKLLEMENTIPDNRKVRKIGQKWKPHMNAGLAVAAGLAICVCSSYLAVSNGGSLSRKGKSENTAGTQEIVMADGETEAQEDGYELAYESLNRLLADGKTAMSKEVLQGLVSGSITGSNVVVGETDDQAFGFMADAETSDALTSNEAKTSSAGESVESYSDTNVRTRGVDEGDIVKTDGEYIYEYQQYVLADEGEKESRGKKRLCNIYKVDGANVKRVSSLYADAFNPNVFLEDMYVSGDRLILVGQFSSYSRKQVKKLYKQAGADFNSFEENTWKLYGEKENMFVNYSVTYVFDISDRSKPQLQRMTFQDGRYFTSRMVEDILYVFSTRTMPLDGIQREEPETYIPQINGDCIGKQHVCVPEDVLTRQYSVITSLRVDNCQMIDEAGVLAGGSELYVSGGNIYLIDESANYQTNGKSVITKFSYEGGKIKKKATGKVKGVVDDDYALDEYEGFLRLVTTYSTEDTTRNALYVLDGNMKVTGSIENIAKDERVYSARFLGDTAYFVTFRETDPLFTADLSDPQNPKIVGKLKLPGYSDYLHPIGDHLLLGLGEEGNEKGDLEGLKLSLYDISNPKKVKEIQKEVLPKQYGYSVATENPNALFIDEERGLVGFTAVGYGDDENLDIYYEEAVFSDYLVYSFDEKTGFQKRLSASLKSMSDYRNGWFETQGRGLYINDNFYVVSVGSGQIESFDYTTFRKKKTNTFKN